MLNLNALLLLMVAGEELSSAEEFMDVMVDCSTLVITVSVSRSSITSVQSLSAELAREAGIECPLEASMEASCSLPPPSTSSPNSFTSNGPSSNLLGFQASRGVGGGSDNAKENVVVTVRFRPLRLSLFIF